MTPIQLLRLVIEALRKEDARYAICGGVAAGSYRPTFRITNNVDIALCFHEGSAGESEREFALKFFESRDIQSYLGWVPGLSTVDKSSIFMIVGKLGGFLPSVDFLLPNLPWLAKAVMRAQNNLIDYGFGGVPTVTPEDLIVSKAFSLKNDPTRLQDRGDIQSILSGKSVKDQQYLEHELKRLNLSIDVDLGNGEL